MSKKTRKKLKEAQAKLVDQFVEIAGDTNNPRPTPPEMVEPTYSDPPVPDQLLSRIQHIEIILNQKKEQHG